MLTSVGTPLTGVVDIRQGYAGYSVLRTDNTMWTWGYGYGNSAGNYGVTNVAGIGFAGATLEMAPDS